MSCCCIYAGTLLVKDLYFNKDKIKRICEIRDKQRLHLVCDMNALSRIKSCVSNLLCKCLSVFQLFEQKSFNLSDASVSGYMVLYTLFHQLFNSWF